MPLSAINFSLPATNAHKKKKQKRHNVIQKKILFKLDLNAYISKVKRERKRQRERQRDRERETERERERWKERKR